MKEYDVKSLDDLCNLVTEDNYERLAVDLHNWLISYHVGMMAVRANFPDQTAGKKNSEIAKGHFIWVDDGEHKVSVTLKPDNEE